jgi:hypothetical protein
MLAIILFSVMVVAVAVFVCCVIALAEEILK